MLLEILYLWYKRVSIASHNYESEAVKQRRMTHTAGISFAKAPYDKRACSFTGQLYSEDIA